MVRLRDKKERIARIKWVLKYISQRADDLTPNDLEWAIRMEEAFKEFGDLSFKQIGIIESIYQRY